MVEINSKVSVGTANNSRTLKFIVFPLTDYI